MDNPQTTDRSARIRTLFDECIDLPPAEQRAYLDRACPDDPELRREVETLLDASTQADLLLAPLDHPTPDPPDRTPDPRIGRRISHYNILEVLGRGGMGILYKAKDTRLGRPVALKFLPRHLSLDPEAKARFYREAKAASALDHVNVGYIHEINETEDGHLYIAMAFYAGETLKPKMAQGPMPVDDVLNYGKQITRGLIRIHSAGIVHRDIKPGNVMVTPEGVVKIVDFGVAKMSGISLTQEGTALGTVAYMSPEQSRGRKVDARSDLWSLGVLLYEMLTGVRPFNPTATQPVIHAILHETPAAVQTLRPDAPPALAQAIDRLLQKDPAARPPSAEALLADLELPTPSSPSGIRTWLQKWGLG